VTTPPLLLSATLLLWGVSTGLLPYAVPMAMVLEGSRLTSWRLKLSESDQNRIADLCSVVFLGMVVYAVSRGRGPHAIYSLLQWTPLALFPLMTAQAYGAEGRIRLCVIAASAIPTPVPWLYPACCAIIGWALWPSRPMRDRFALWGISLAIALALGYPLQAGLREAHLALEDLVGSWLSDLVRHRTNPYRATTAIGYIGKLKLSDRILLRVTTSGDAPPRLLREASYNTYTTFTWRRSSDSLGVGTWFAKRPSFRPALSGRRAARRALAAVRRARGDRPHGNDFWLPGRWKGTACTAERHLPGGPPTGRPRGVQQPGSGNGRGWSGRGHVPRRVQLRGIGGPAL
jgi:hypothetical protein